MLRFKILKESFFCPLLNSAPIFLPQLLGDGSGKNKKTTLFVLICVKIHNYPALDTLCLAWVWLL